MTTILNVAESFLWSPDDDLGFKLVRVKGYDLSVSRAEVNVQPIFDSSATAKSAPKLVLARETQVFPRIMYAP